MPHILLVDLRTQSEFNHVHLPGAHCYPFDEVIIEQFKPYRNQTVVFVCSYGKKSAYLAQRLQEFGYNAWGISGGIAERSTKNLPRQVETHCNR